MVKFLSQLVVVMLNFADAVAKVTDISGSKDRNRQGNLRAHRYEVSNEESTPPLATPEPVLIPIEKSESLQIYQPVPPPTEVGESVQEIFDSVFGDIASPLTVNQETLPEEPVVYQNQVLDGADDDTELEEIPATIPKQLPMTMEQVKEKVMDMFSDYLYLLDREEFKLAADLGKKIRFEKADGYSFIWILEQLIQEGVLADSIPVDTKFTWVEDDQDKTSYIMLEVPAKKRAMALLLGLQQRSWDQMQAEKLSRRATVESPEEMARRRARLNGGVGATIVTGKTDRERAKVRGPKPPRVGPAKGHNATPPKHGSKRK